MHLRECIMQNAKQIFGKLMLNHWDTQGCSYTHLKVCKVKGKHFHDI